MMNIKSKLLVVSTLALSTSANAALIERLGGLAYYDDVADLTWLAATTGPMSWTAASNWALSLDVAGVTDWRLPSTEDVNFDGATYTNLYQGVDFGYNITAHSEMSNMFYNVLGNIAYYDTAGVGPQAGYGLVNTGPFSTLQSDYYWSATTVGGFEAWTFNMGDGVQNINNKNGDYYAMAVYSGDVSAVPVPAAAWLFGSGLIGLVGVARRKRA